MIQKWFLPVLFIITQSCNTPVEDHSEKSPTEIINLQAPFYSRQLPNGHPRVFKEYDSSKIENYWPFIIYKDSSYMVAAEIERDTLDNLYLPFFERFGGDGSGYNWEAIITVMLEKENPELIKHLQFDPEAGGFYVFADSERSQRKFADFVSKAFNDSSKLIRYLTGPDRERALGN